MTDLDRHCKRGGCPCPHRDPCYQGFEDYYDATRGEWLSVFCAICRGQQRKIVDESRDAEERGRRLRARGMSQQWTGA